MGHIWYNPQKKPSKYKAHQVKRLKFAKKSTNRGPNFWKTMLYTDERMFKVFEGKKTSKWIAKNNAINNK